MVSLFVIAVCSAMAPLLTALCRKLVPDVVWLLLLGVVVGDSVLGWASISEGVTMVREIGMGLLFLIAGYEMAPRPLATRQGRSAALTWVICLITAFGIALLAVPSNSWRVAIALAICACSTALGTLLPILKQAGDDSTPLGRAVLLHGAMGELGPVLTMSLLLGVSGPLRSAIVLVIFMLISIAATTVPRRIVERIPWVGQTVKEGAETTSQSALRFLFALLTGLMALSEVFSLDLVLGAFAAGLVARALNPEGHKLEHKLEVVGFSFLIPVFFVTSGMAISLSDVSTEPVLLCAMVVTMLVARGVPVWLIEKFTTTGSGITTETDRMRLGLYSATGLPIIVAVTELAVHHDLLPKNIGSVLVAAGAVTVLLFPLLASLLDARNRRTASNS